MRAVSPLTSSENVTLQTELNRASPDSSFTGGLQERQTFDQLLTVMLTFTLVMLMLAVVISIIGVANTMTLSVNERRRENAMLRSLGLSRKQLRRMISIEAILITLAAVVLGMIAGTVIGAVSAKIVMAAVAPAPRSCLTCRTSGTWSSSLWVYSPRCSLRRCLRLVRLACPRLRVCAANRHSHNPANRILSVR